MDLYVDGRCSDHDGEDNRTLNEVLETVRRANARSDKAILALVCDGEEIVAEDRLTESLLRPASSFQRIDIATGSPRSMIVQAVNAALATLDDSEEDRRQAVRHFGQGKQGEAGPLLGSCLRQWHQVNETIAKSLGLLRVMDESMALTLATLAEVLEPVSGKLGEIRSAVQSQDYVALADILEYEFDDVIASWRSVLQSVLDAVQQPDSEDL